MSESSSPLQRLFVWELPLRLFHWALVALVIALYLSIEVMDNIDRHAQLGYALLALLLFRLIWGFSGGTYARFGNFLHGPRTVLGYLHTLPAKQHEAIPGHNPLGGWMVMLLLLGFLATAVFNLLAIFFSIPSKAPPHIKRMFLVLTGIRCCSGCSATTTSCSTARCAVW